MCRRDGVKSIDQTCVALLIYASCLILDNDVVFPNCADLAQCALAVKLDFNAFCPQLLLTGWKGQGMWRAFALVGAALLLADCAASGPSPETGGMVEKMSITRRLQNNWDRCLEQSYRVTRTQTPDKNAAAEMAFKRAPQEQDLVLASGYAGQLLQPHLRSEKQSTYLLKKAAYLSSTSCPSQPHPT